MNTILTILVAVIGFGILVFFHEGGHFVVAKLFGVKVETFAIGWGPKLIGFTKGGTSYQISVFPIGGFCKFKGDEASVKVGKDATAKSDDGYAVGIDSYSTSGAKTEAEYRPSEEASITKALQP